MNATAAPPRYFLSRDAHVCLSGDRVIILDLASGDYMGLAIEDAKPLGEWIQGWPVAQSTQEEPRALQQLLEAGLITRSDPRGPREESIRMVVDPRESLLDRPGSTLGRTRAHHVYAFLLAVITVAVSLRLFDLRRIVTRVRRRKAAHRANAFDIEKARELVSIFNDLYPWFLGSRGNCLRNSLMLWQFLAHYGVYPEWVFAVRGEPFSAHCWLQHEEVLLNDRLVITAALTPIMVV